MGFDGDLISWDFMGFHGDSIYWDFVGFIGHVTGISRDLYKGDLI